MQACEVQGVKVFRFEGTVMFASFEYFKTKLIQKTGCDPLKLRKQQKRAAKVPAASPDARLPQRNESDNSIESATNGGTSGGLGGNGGRALEEGSASPTAATAIELNNANNELSITSGTSGISERSEVCAVVKLNGGGASFASAATGADSVKGILKATGHHSGYQCLQIGSNVHHIILDCSVWAFVDDTAVKLLADVNLQFLELFLLLLIIGYS